MKVLLHGNFEETHLGKSYLRAFRKKGHEVETIDIRNRSEDLKWWLTNRYAHRITIKSLTLRKWGSTYWNRVIIDQAKQTRPDFILILEGKYIMPETVKKLKEYSRLVLMLNADNPLPKYPNSRPEHIPAALLADGYFIWSRKLVQKLKKRGVEPVHYLPFGWDSEVFPYTPLQKNPEYEVVFIGNWDKNREQILEKVAKKFNLKIWGSNYWLNRTKSGSELKKCWQGKPLYGKEAVEVIANSKICINILREQNLPDGTNMRTFEVPGAGGFLLSTWSEGANEIFPEGERGVYFRNQKELMEKIDYYLTNENKRRSIIEEAHQKVREETYEMRAMSIIKLARSFAEG